MAAAVSITPADLAPFAEIDEAKAQAMIDDAMARAALIAPCITSDDFENTAAAKAIIRGAILRWNDAGSGAITSESIAKGPFSHSQTIDTKTTRRSMFWPSEIDELKSLCPAAGSGAFSVDTVGGGFSMHADICALRFGALYCSCGADLTGGAPLWED
jgi:hypothetical protein